MLLEIDVRTAMVAAVAKEENRYANGEINWNFVDADAFMDCVADSSDRAACDRFYELFEKIADDLSATEIA